MRIAMAPGHLSGYQVIEVLVREPVQGEESALSRDFIGQTRPIREAGGTGRFRVQVRACTGTLAAGFILSSGHFDYLIWRAIAMLALSAVAALFAASQVDQLERSP